MPKPVGIARVSLGNTGACHESQPHGIEPLISFQLPKMIAAGGGKVINVASDAARVGSSGESVYAACKAGLVGFSKTVARELATKNVCLNVVCPGPTDTALLKGVAETAPNPEKLLEAFRNAVPMKRLAQPEDYPGIIALLASDDANFITGQVISVSGGLTMAG